MSEFNYEELEDMFMRYMEEGVEDDVKLLDNEYYRQQEIENETEGMTDVEIADLRFNEQVLRADEQEMIDSYHW